MRIIPVFAIMLGSSALLFASAEPHSQDLNSGWEFRAIAGAGRADLTSWHPAQVPGVVHMDLLRNGLLPVPFYGDNDARLQWIGLTDWEYRTSFAVEPAVLGNEHLDLVFEG